MTSLTLPGSCVRQIVLRALFSSDRTPVAPAIKVTIPMMLLTIPLEGRLAAPFSMSWIAAALFGPTSPPISAMIFPWAASWPSTSPAIEMARIRRGAMEKVV